MLRYSHSLLIIMSESTLPVFQDFVGAEVWKYFLRSLCGKFAQCKGCKQVLSAKVGQPKDYMSISSRAIRLMDY